MTNAYLWRNPVVDEAAARRIAETGKLPLPVARALARRGLTTPAAAADFLAPGIQQLADPFALPDMAAAVERLRRALAARETILIHGDYDVDGISSAALLTRVLRALEMPSTS